MTWATAYRQLCEIERMAKDVIMGDHSDYAKFTDCWEKLHDINMLLKEWDSERGEDLKRRLIYEAMEETEREEQ